MVTLSNLTHTCFAVFLWQDASVWMAMDKEATREDAERVVVAEMRNNPEMRAHPGGVGASMVAAARLNQER